MSDEAPLSPGPGAGPTRDDIADVERWLYRNGLPYFVDSTRTWVRRQLRPGRLVTAGLACVALGLAVGWVATGDKGSWLVAGYIAATIVPWLLVGYAMFVLRGVRITRWAAQRTFDSLGLLFPLATRALPMLLLFITFLFINTEVWMVAAKLTGNVMVATVFLFLLAAAGFLVARLPEETGNLEAGLDTERITVACAGTPLSRWTTLDQRPGVDEPIVGLERANLVLVMLISQLIQVLMLAASVFAFFLVFGMVTMHPDVVKAWIGHAPTSILGQDRLSVELLQVSAFLSAFAGLYFTVYAVTDEIYRKQFFSSILGELERAVCVREVYRAMVRAADRQAPDRDHTD